MSITVVTCLLVLALGAGLLIGIRIGSWLAGQREWEASRIAATSLEEAAQRFVHAQYLNMDEDVIAAQNQLLDSALGYAQSQGWKSGEV